MNKAPLITIIIVNYNGAHYLPACLDALRNQTFPADQFEVIVSDNGSTDDSLKILRETYSWVRVLENNQNLGFASGNNVAIQAAHGEDIILLNNDTAPSPTWLENMVNTSEDNPRAGLVTGHLQLFYDQLPLKLQADTFSPPDDTRELGIQVFEIDSGAPRGVVQFLDGFYGIESQQPGKHFRWTKGSATLGIPVPKDEGDWSLRIDLAAPRTEKRNVKIRVYLDDSLLTTWTISGDAPESFHLKMPATTRQYAKRVEQNTGSIVFRNGAGRDRGTYVQNFEVFFEEDQGKYSRIEEVFAGCGASLLLKQEMLADVGLLDDDFFMYYEDTDISWRARLRGWQVLFAPEAIVRHIHCGTSNEWSPAFQYLTERNRLAMVYKNGDWGQVSRVWGGYLLKVTKLGWNTLVVLLSRRKDWRQSISQMIVHLRVITRLIFWLPSLSRKRSHIQRNREVSPKTLETWFEE